MKRILYSFWYIYLLRREGFVDRIQQEYPDVKFFLDSGAFTYKSKREKDPESLIPWPKYKKLYFNYIEATQGRWARIAEMDFDHLEGVNINLLAEWRDEMVERWPDANVCPVWHPSRGLAEWRSYCRDPRFRHLCIGSSQRNTGQVHQMVMEAHQWNKTVHGFGMTRANSQLRVVPYDTVDSSSWLSSSKYGTMFIFQNNKFSLLSKDGSQGKNARRLYAKYFKKIGCDPKKVIADDIHESRKASIIAWRALSDRLVEMRKRQGRVDEERDTDQRVNLEHPWEEAVPREGSELQGPYARERTDEEATRAPQERGSGAAQDIRQPRERGE